MEAKDALSANGQQAAIDYLEEQGLRVLDRNWHHLDGQLDIVAAEGSTVVICEIRSSGSLPLDEKDEATAVRLRALGETWLTSHGIDCGEVRIDAIGVRYEDADNFIIEHIRGIY
jgi:putative endonuclease